MPLRLSRRRRRHASASPSDKGIKERVQKAIAGVLADQASTGSFGLWGPYDTGRPLARRLRHRLPDAGAPSKGYDVPKLARDIALDNLANQVVVLATTSRRAARTSPMRSTCWPGAAGPRSATSATTPRPSSAASRRRSPRPRSARRSALYGDRQRAATAFQAAFTDLDTAKDDWSVWRGDYGSTLRDRAAVLTLAAETSVGSGRPPRPRRADRHRRTMPASYTSTQENAWMLLAAAALIKDASRTSFAIDGASIAGPLYKRFSAERIDAAPVVDQEPRWRHRSTRWWR